MAKDKDIDPRDPAHSDFIPGVSHEVARRDQRHDELGLGWRSPQKIRITWWSNGTRAKEIEVELPERGKTATMEMYDQDKITVERR